MEVSVSYLNYSPHTIYIDVIDSSKYGGNKDFSNASMIYRDGEEEKPLYMASLAKNGSTAYLDYLSKKSKILIVPYYFSEDKDNVATEDNQNIIKDTFLGDETVIREHKMPYSLKSYYETSSYGKMAIDGFVTPWLPSHIGDGSSNSIKNGAVEAAPDIPNTYITEYNKENHGLLGHDELPLTDFDSNNDGIIDLLWIVYSR